MTSKCLASYRLWDVVDILFQFPFEAVVARSQDTDERQ
jgi:hypothetical protein